MSNQPREGLRRMKIVFLSFKYWPPDFGGEMLHCIERLQALAQRGHSVVALTRRPPGSSRSEQQDGITVQRCPVAGRGLVARLAYLLWTLKVLSLTPYDALHLNFMPARRKPTAALVAWLYGALAKARRARTVSVVAIADNDEEVWRIRGKDGALKRLYYTNVDHLVAVSPALFNALDHWWPGKSILLPYGVRDDLFTPLSSHERRLARRALGLPEDAVVFITIGSAGRRKGIDLLAKAFARLAPQHPNWFLWLVGPMSRAEGCATDEQELAEIMAPLQEFPAQVRFCGRVNDRGELRQLLGASDVFAFPTRREGMPLSPMEAMAMGLPVVMSRIPGVTDVACVDQETGIFVPVDDVESLTRAMDRLGGDPLIRLQWGNNARRRINREFTWNIHISQWERIYRDGAAMRTPIESDATVMLNAGH